MENTTVTINGPQFITDNGIDLVNGQILDNQTLSYNLQNFNTPSGYGKAVTCSAATRMICDKIKNNISDALKGLQIIHDRAQKKAAITNMLSNDRLAIEFGKLSILQILTQDNCVGIRFVRCLYKGEESLVLMGVTLPPNNPGVTIPIGAHYYHAKARSLSGYSPMDEPRNEEAGNGTDSIKVLSDMGYNVDNIIEEILNETEDNELISESLAHRLTNNLFKLA